VISVHDGSPSFLSCFVTGISALFVAITTLEIYDLTLDLE